MLQWVLLSYTIEEKTTWGLMVQWVLLSYTIEEKTTGGSDVTVSTVKLYNRRKNNMGSLMYSEYC